MTWWSLICFGAGVFMGFLLCSILVIASHYGYPEDM
jgi:hypothetical protein